MGVPWAGQREGTELGRGRRQRCPGVTEAGGQTPEPALPVQDPGAHSSESGGHGSLTVPTTATSRMVSCQETSTQTSTGLSWPSSPPLHHAVSSRSPLTPTGGKKWGKQQDKIVWIFHSVFCFYNMNRRHAMVCEFYITFSSIKPINQ